MKREKLQTQTITLPTGTLAGTYEFTVLGGFAITGLTPFEIDNNFKRVAGISFIVVASSIATPPRVSLKDVQDTFINNTKTDFLFSNNVADSNERFFDLNLKGKGNKIYVSITIANNLVSPYILDIVYKLDNEDYTKNPRIKYDSRNVTIAAGGTPVQTNFAMDIYYKKVTDICLHVFTQTPGTDYLRLNFFDIIGEFIGMVPQYDIQFSNVINKKKIWTKVQFVRCTGNQISVQFTSPSVLANTINSDIVFKLSE